MEKFINILTIALLIIAGFYFMTEINQSGYDKGYDEGFSEAWELREESYDKGYIKGYDNGYQACVEEYNLYLPYE